jgi:hypothetical protein
MQSHREDAKNNKNIELSISSNQKLEMKGRINLYGTQMQEKQYILIDNFCQF